ncbi:MAG: hypothetical protein PF572_02335 [Patescibacteria group bacterium]|jgi:hypothetical protein|nr:hypothetical protein [Patescibacteria group bacterium]
MRNNILNAIYNKLSSIEDLKEVYKYNKGHFTKYPVAIILGSENEKVRESVKTIKKIYKFKLQILQEINENTRGQEDGENLLINLSEIIDDMFDHDDTLGGACDDVQVASSFTWEDRELLMRVLEMEIICIKLKQLT